MTKREEDSIHGAVVQHLRQRGVPGLIFWHTPNDGKRGYKAASRLKRMGMRAGVSDIILVHDGRIYGLELKTEKGRASEEQSQFLYDLNGAGGYGCICHGLDRALKTLEAWGLVR